MTEETRTGVAYRTEPEAAGDERLRMVGVTKRFGAVRALTDVTFDVRAGEVHALVGENGAGKSTLMSIAAGALGADAGSVHVNGQELSGGVESSRDAGLAIVYQHPALMPDLTIAENMALAMPSASRPSWRNLDAWAAEALAVWCVDRHIDPSLPVRDVPADVRFMVEISRALAQQPAVLLLDEPTEHLGARDVETLFTEVRRVVAAGAAVVYISHRLPEVQRIADRISVLRDGELQLTGPAAGLAHDDLVRLIVGQPVEQAFPPKSVSQPAGAPVLEVRGLTAGMVRDFDLSVAGGEIVGLAGIDGNGQRDVLRSLAGLLRSTGSVAVDGREVRSGSTSAATAAGMAFIPADRHREGLLSTLSVRENIALGSLSRLARAGIVDPERERRLVASSVAALGVKAPTMETPVAALSGGNQQKTVIGRALERSPRLILADEPAQGVDVGARTEIYNILRAATDSGAAALVVASDAAELAGLCDRVLVLSRGQVVAELTGDAVTEERIVEAAVTSSVLREPDSASRPRSRWRRLLRSDFAPPLGVLLITLLLGAYTATRNDAFLTGPSLTNVFTLFAVLAFAALAQQLVMITGGIDLSIGPLMGLLVVVGSAVMPDPSGAGVVILGLVLLVVVAGAVGVVNWAPGEVLGVPAFLTTLVTFTALQGVALLIQPEIGAPIDLGLLDTVTTLVGWMPVAAVVALLAAVGLDVALRRTRWGVSLRAVGSDPAYAHATGVRVGRIRLVAHLAAAVLAVLAALLLMAQVGAGDPLSGNNYTLTTVTAVVIGGASVFGGRGACVGALAGALLIQQINTTTGFLQMNVAWQMYLLGGLIFVSAALYSRVRGG
jgi:ribose transport system ATP-binding protein